MDVNLPSQTADHHEQEVIKDMTRKKHILTSMHVIYGGAIIILAIIVTGVVCVLGSVDVPYISDFYTPVVPPPYVSPTSQRMLAHPNVPSATSSVPTASSTMSSTTNSIATSTHKKL